MNEGFVEGTKNFRVSLSNPTGGAVLGVRTNVLVSITDNDAPLTVEFVWDYKPVPVGDRDLSRLQECIPHR